MPRITLKVKNAAERNEYDSVGKEKNPANNFYFHKQGKRPKHLVRLLSTFYSV